MMTLRLAFTFFLLFSTNSALANRTCAEQFSNKDIKEIFSPNNHRKISDEYNSLNQAFKNAFGGVIFGGEALPKDKVATSNFVAATKSLLSRFELPQATLKEMNPSLENLLVLFTMGKANPRREALEGISNDQIIEIIEKFLLQKNHNLASITISDYVKPVVRTSLLQRAVRNGIITEEMAYNLADMYKAALERLSAG